MSTERWARPGLALHSRTSGFTSRIKWCSKTTGHQAPVAAVVVRGRGLRRSSSAGSIWGEPCASMGRRVPAAPAACSSRTRGRGRSSTRRGHCMSTSHQALVVAPAACDRSALRRMRGKSALRGGRSVTGGEALRGPVRRAWGACNSRDTKRTRRGICARCAGGARRSRGARRTRRGACKGAGPRAAPAPAAWIGIPLRRGIPVPPTLTRHAAMSLEAVLAPAPPASPS
mmetsp:Transcript_49001/g.146415  ORF Transcript_49001/g.146415 Transcript_49001/m.146415 type:complete len:229 (-) Transcript_49001:384-1070(-)